MTTAIGWQAAEGRSYGGPGRYVQRAGELRRLPEHLQDLGTRAFLLVDRIVAEEYGEAIRASLGKAEARIETFGGECCTEEIDRVAALVAESGADVVAGIGGGKTADTAKVAGMRHRARIVVVPTIASTDAPCSAIAVRYNQEGVMQEAMALPRNPDLVVVDSAVVAKAPARFLVSGMGDALSTFFEARSNLESRSPNFIRPNLPAPEAGIAIARACHEVLMRDGLAAKLAAERNLLTPAVEAIIEANTLLSGLGFENCGVSGAHGIHDGMTVLPATRKFFHGEKVAFGTLCLLMLEGRPLAEIAATAAFCRSVGLPTTLADLDLGQATPDDIGRVAEAALKPGAVIGRVATPLSPTIVRDAILALDAYTSGLARSA
ncbi:glycerol dehydrogenase [Aureimonas leprariae]|uniref:Glycerol dehydrogenase n=1 Tax=Plantimonas leprariae TaxID=2615207 RepID=A0A7V7PSZ4_9HYPH|nr:glycerol dehydrogenase [Aureimonas leprariae]KAB0682794.1 glycerol dehydrogenase [Aureimonas leprariae]